MGQQLSLPAGGAKSLFSSTDPAERLSELVDDRREAFGDIRLVLDSLSAKYHFRPREIDAATGQVDDVLGDLFYETRSSWKRRSTSGCVSAMNKPARGQGAEAVALRLCRTAAV